MALNVCDFFRPKGRIPQDLQCDGYLEAAEALLAQAESASTDLEVQCQLVYAGLWRHISDDMHLNPTGHTAGSLGYAWTDKQLAYFERQALEYEQSVARLVNSTNGAASPLLTPWKLGPL